MITFRCRIILPVEVTFLMRDSGETRTKALAAGRTPSCLVLAVVTAAVAFSSPQFAAGATRAGDGGPDTVLATIGDHPITQREVDSKVGGQLYDLRKQSLDEIIDDYVLRKAAKLAGMKPDQYLGKQVSSSRRVTDDEAKQYYQQHKAQLDARTGGHSFEQIKPRLIAAMQHERNQEVQEQLIQNLRAKNHVNVILQAPHVSVASAGHPSTGSASAPVTVVEFSDFQCPFCRAAENTLKQVRQKYGDRVKLVYMDFPLGFHQHAMDAARAARCAADQNKFWQFHDALFADQAKLSANDLKQTATAVGLDRTKFNGCFDSGGHNAGIQQDVAEGSSLGVTGTPTFFVNGRELVGAQPPPKFDEVIDEELARAKPPGNSREAKAN
jgi:protein-disulfide isomerase